MNFTKESNVTKSEIKLFEKICKIKDRKIAEVLKMRSENKTLQEIGLYLGVTRERIRQMEAKGIMYILVNR